MKKAFTLIEVIISIALFMILLVFLYQSLEVTKQSNNFYDTKLVKLNNINHIKALLYEDIAQASSVEVSFDSRGQSILKLQSSNMFHNVFYKHITYVISQKKNLIRLESLNKFNEKEVLDSFFEEAYADRILNNIEQFKVSSSRSNQNIYTIILKQEKSNVVLLNTLRL